MHARALLSESLSTKHARTHALRPAHAHSVYVFGGQSGELETNKDADVYDPVADATKRVDVNDAMSEPTISNFYATMFVLPQGKLAVFNHNHAQVRCLFCFLICVAAVLTNAAITTRAHNTVRLHRAPPPFVSDLINQMLLL